MRNCFMEQLNRTVSAFSSEEMASFVATMILVIALVVALIVVPVLPIILLIVLLVGKNQYIEKKKGKSRECCI